ncbi:MAG TPA: hypothetical protein VFG87_20945 [Amycolatopsis sp.]|jgi:hypothetical protein|nr:hypothetical protein [Amycolatopsis sp.]
MDWQCAECYARGAEANAEVVCHHCGKPLCGNDWMGLEDNAFSDVPGPLTRFGFHCRECWQRHHPGVKARAGGTAE